MDADTLATNHRISHSTQSSQTIDHLPSTLISISLNGRRLTGKIDEAIRYHVDGYPLRQYLQHKHSWDNKVWDSIDFYLFGRHFKQLTPQEHTAHMKVVHDQQPLGKRRFQQATIKDPAFQLCPCCKRAPETQFHLFQCTANPERQTILSQFQRTVCNSVIHPVKYVLTAGIQHWLQDPTERYQPSLTEFPTHHYVNLLAALHEQESIGWHNTILGFLSKKWQIAAATHMSDSTQLNPSMGTDMIFRIIKALHTLTQSLWLSRTARLHDRNDEIAREIQSSEAAEIRYFHSNPQLLPMGDHHYCARSLSQLLCSSRSVRRRRWLRHIRSARASHLRHGLHQNNITTFFTAVKTPRIQPKTSGRHSPPPEG